MQTTLLTLLAASSAYASPVWKRQDISSAASSVIASATAAASSASAPVLTSASVDSAALSSLASSAAPSASASAAVTYPGYPCPAGTDLGYVELQQNYNEALGDITAIVGNFTTASWLNVVNPSGEDTVGVTRTLQFNNATTVEEVLVNKTTNAETGATYINWNNTAPLSLDGLTIYNYSTVLQSYINDTETSDDAPVTTVKLFSNFCTDQQDAGIAGLTEYFRAALGNVETSSPVASSSASGVVPSISSVLSSAVESATSAVESATSVVSSAVASASGAATSAASSVVSGASSAVSSVAPPTATGPTGDLLINTPPSIIQCQPALLSFSGGVAPYIISVLPGGQSSAAPLVIFPSQPAAGTYTWVANVPAGTAITLSVRDGSGLVNYSSVVTILGSPDSSCLTAAPSSA